MQFNKAAVLTKKELSWNNFEIWGDFENITHGFWGEIFFPFPFAFVVMPETNLDIYNFNIFGLKFVEINPEFIKLNFVYPGQQMKNFLLYITYNKVDRNWMNLGKASIFYNKKILFNFNSIFTFFLGLNLNSPFKINLISSIYSKNNFNMRQFFRIIYKFIWQSFYNWLDMAKWKNGAWSG